MTDIDALDETTVSRRIGTEIRTLREKAGLSTRELAREAGISQPFLSQIERGVSAPSMVTTYRIARALGVLPGALLPAPDTALVEVVRADQGRMLPVANRADAALGRALMMRSDSALEIIEYIVQPGEYLSEWFELEGDLAVYLISGLLDVEVEGVGVTQMRPRDLVSHRASLRHRWTLADDAPAHVLLMILHPRD